MARIVSFPWTHSRIGLGKQTAQPVGIATPPCISQNRRRNRCPSVQNVISTFERMQHPLFDCLYTWQANLSLSWQLSHRVKQIWISPWMFDDLVHFNCHDFRMNLARQRNLRSGVYRQSAETLISHMLVNSKHTLGRGTVCRRNRSIKAADR